MTIRSWRPTRRRPPHHTVIRDLKLNIRSMNLASRGGLLTGTIDVEVPATSVVDTLIHAILRIKGVQRAFRANG